MTKILSAIFALLLLIGCAFAQSNPGLRQDQVPTAAQWNSYFAAKQDYLGFPVIGAGNVLGSAPIVATPAGSNVTISCAAFAGSTAGCVPTSLGGTVNFLREDGSWVVPTCTAFSSGSAGCVPASGGGTTNFIRADGAWTVPPGTFACASNIFTSGAAGCVPASGGGTANFLRADGTFAAPPGAIGSITVGTTVVNSGANKTFYDNNGLLGSGPEVIPTAFTRAAIQAAVTAVCNAGGGTVRLLDGDYIYASGNDIVLIDCSNIRIQGSPKTRLIAPADSTAIGGLLRPLGPATNATTISANAAIGDLVIAMTSVSGYAAGDYLSISITSADGYGYSLVTKIVSIASLNVTIADPLPFSFTFATETSVVFEATMLENVQIDNIRFVGTSNSGLTRGVFVSRCAQCRFTNLYFEDFTAAAAIYMQTGYGNIVDTITAKNSGTSSESDVTINNQTGGQFDKISSFQAFGFGPQFGSCSFIQVGLVNSHKSAGRGIKLAGVRFSTFGSLIGNNSGSTGVAITLGSSDNQIGQIVALKNVLSGGGNGNGVWFSAQHNQRNTIGSIRAYKSVDWDIILFATDNDNIIVAAQYGTLSNTGTNNSIVTTKVTTP